MSMELTRRAVLASTLAIPVAVTAACQSESPVIPPDQDTKVKEAVATNEAELMARYQATIAAFPQLRPRLQGILSQHEEHHTAMGGDSSATNKQVVVSTSQSVAIRDLIAAEHGAAKARTRACTQATDTELAWTLALIGGSEASHAEFLRLRVLG